MECAMLENELLGQKELVGSVHNPRSQPYGVSGTLEVDNTWNGGPSGSQGEALGAGSVLRFGMMWAMMPVALVACSLW